MDTSPTATTVAVDPRHVGYTHIMYALHASAVVIALLTSASILGKFVFGLPSLIAIVMNYVRADAVQGTWLESHFQWQRRTFWVAAIACAVFFLLFWTIILIPVILVAWVVVGIWAAYRIGRGWLALKDGRTLPRTGV